MLNQPDLDADMILQLAGCADQNLREMNFLSMHPITECANKRGKKEISFGLLHGYIESCSMHASLTRGGEPSISYDYFLFVAFNRRARH